MASPRAIAVRTAPTSSPQPQRPTSRRDFEIAVICALPLEADAVDAAFDHHWDDDGGPSFGKAQGDPNAYSTGAIGRHNVVLAHMPGMGKAHAAAVASNIHFSFPNIKLALVVGVCGCAPFSPDGDEIILGDVIVSTGVVQYDLGRRTPERFVRKDTLSDSLGRPNTEVRSLLAKLGGFRGRKMLQEQMSRYLAAFQREPGLAANYPGAVHDKLFNSRYRHIADGQSCDKCGCDGPLVPRKRLLQDGHQPVVHFGMIASGDTVLKSGHDRDGLVKGEDVIGFEMEGAGVWDSFPCVVIKGACDYADSHKTKAWQRYAAASAAACMKAFLESWVPSSSSRPELVPAQAPTNGNSSRLISVPFLKNRNFVGRDAILDLMKHKLFLDQDCQTLAIVGLGGMGKTQVALQFAYWVRDNHAEYTILWVSALSRASFEQACRDIGKKLGILKHADKESPTDLLRDHLSSDDAGKWLLIIDNLDDQAILPGTSGVWDYLPTSETGLTVLTTRSMDVGISVASSDIIELQEMDGKEAQRFLEKSLVRRQLLQDEAATADLLRELTNLPLAIAQAATYMNRNRCSVRKYLELLDGTEQDLVSLMSREFQDSTRYRASQNAIATTWIVSFDQIRRDYTMAAELLTFIAFIEPKNIPRSLLPEYETEEEKEHAIGTLSAYGFLTKREDCAIYDMHSLVHLATKVWLEREYNVEESLVKALRHTTNVLPRDFMLAKRQLWQGYLPHAVRILDRYKGYKVEERFDLLELVGRYLLLDRQLKTSISYLEEVYQWRAHLPAENEARLSSEHGLAGAYHFDDRVTDAIPIPEHVVRVRQRILDEKNKFRLASENELASAYLDDGSHMEAILMLERIVRIRQGLLSEEDRLRLGSEHELARAYLLTQQTQAAIAILEHVVRVGRNKLAEDDYDRLESEHELARAYNSAGRFKDEIEVLEYVVRVHERVLGIRDWSKSRSKYLLGCAYLAGGRVKEAIAVLEDVVRTCQSLDKRYVNRLRSERWLARAYLCDGRAEAAIAILERVTETSKGFDEEDEDRLRAEHELAKAYLGVGRNGDAVSILVHVVTVRRRLGEGHMGRRLESELLLVSALSQLNN